MLETTHKLPKIISIFTLAVVSILPVTGSAETAETRQIVRNLSGDLVILHDDQTWDIFEFTVPPKKVVFSIYEAKNYYSEHIDEDDFGNREIGYYIGCAYSYKIENNTDYTVSVYRPRIQSDDPFFSGNYWHPKVDGVIQPQEIAITSSVTLGMRHEQKFSDPLSLDEIKSLFPEYGCERQKGSIYFETAYGENYVVKFDPSSGISDDAAIEFVTTNDGVVPLQRHIRH